MKALKIVSTIVLSLGILVLLGTCTKTKTSMPTDNFDELLGIWVNPDYEGGYSGKFVIKEDGTVPWYSLIKSGTPHINEHIDVKEKWMDRKGAMYFKINFNSERTDTTCLLKVSSDAKTLEILAATTMELLHSEMIPDAPYCSYHVYYRQ